MIILFGSPKGHWSEGSLVRKKIVKKLATCWQHPHHNLNSMYVVVDFRNKETLNRFSHVHAVMPFRNSD